MPLCLCCIATWDEQRDGKECPGRCMFVHRMEYDEEVGKDAPVETQCVTHGTSDEEVDRRWDAIEEAPLEELRQRFGVAAR